MDLKEAILKIPTLIEKLGMAEAKPVEAPNEGETEPSTEQSFMDAKLSDGTIVSWEGDLMQGTPLFVMDETGNRLPAPDGVLELEDGTILEVVGGSVAAIKPAAEVQEPSGDAPVEASNDSKGLTPSEAKRLVETVIKETVFAKEDIEAKFAALEKENAELKEKFADSEKLLTETFKLVEKIADSPSVAPAPKKDGFMIERSVKTQREEIEEFRKRNNI